MPTNNPKISGYVPQPVYDRLIQFKDREGVSVSQAVTIILAEYFGIEQTLEAQSTVGGVTLARMESLESELGSLASEVADLRSELQRGLRSSLEGHDNLDQLNLIGPEFGLTGRSPGSSLNVADLGPMTGKALSNRFGFNPDYVGQAKRKFKGDTKAFADWSKQRDPNGIPWEFCDEDWKYHPIL